jgi:hypothetical protein
MKRIVAAIFALSVLGGIFGLWWFLHDTPEKVLRDGFIAMLKLKTAKSLALDISWTDVVTRTTTGFAYAGQADLKSWTRPRALGILRLGAATAQGQNQTGDIIVESSALALRPRSVRQELRTYYEKLSNDPTDTVFLVIDRDTFLGNRGFAKAVSDGDTENLKRQASFIIPALVPIGGLTEGTEAGRPSVTASFRIDRKSIQAVLIELIKAWMKDNPTPEEYGWADMASVNLATGRFELTLDKTTRLPLTLKGTFSQLDETGKETRKISFTLAFDGHNQKVDIGIPEKSKDVTQTIIQKVQSRSFLPQAKLRALPGAATTTGAAKHGAISTSTGKMINEKETDLFEKYYEEMMKKKNQLY